MPEPGRIFDPRPTVVRPLPTFWPLERLFPDRVALLHARGSQPSERVAFLLHGLAMNEDYFGLLVPELIERGYDVWALRLPGYAASGEQPGELRPHIGFSVAYYAWVAASALVHLARTLDPPAREMLAWGHSLGGVVIAAAARDFYDAVLDVTDRFVFEAPAFGETLGLPGSTVAVLATLPDRVLNSIARSFLLDDIRAHPFAEAQSEFRPGRASRLLLTMNVVALCNPFSRMPAPSPAVRDRSWFVVGEHDRLVDHDRLVALLDRWGVSQDRRLVLPRNHFLSLTVPRALLDWVEGRRA